jgi:predicted alpha/beta-fold hydrolase
MVDDLFEPHPWLRNPHLMTIIPALRIVPMQRLARSFEPVLVDVAADSKVLIHCHLSRRKLDAPILLLVHGLEGSSSAPYLLSLTKKALTLGCGVVRMNLRNCGGTLHLTPTLYNAGMSADVIAVADYIRSICQSNSIYLVGYSLGGNVVLKAAAELGAGARGKLAGVCAVSPSLDLDACISAIETGFNRLYEIRFLLGLKQKIRQKSALFPERYDAAKLDSVSGLRSFDELFTAPDAGYEGASDYYKNASALTKLARIEVPTLIIAAQDDPLVPFHSFVTDHLKASPYVSLLAPAHGGHGGFINKAVQENDTDRQWAENRVIEFCLKTTVEG